MCCVFQCVKKIQILYVCLHIGHAHTVTAVTVCAAGRTRNKSCKSSTLQSQQKQHTAVTVCAAGRTRNKSSTLQSQYVLLLGVLPAAHTLVACPTMVAWYGVQWWGNTILQHNTIATPRYKRVLPCNSTAARCSTLQHYTTAQCNRNTTLQKTPTGWRRLRGSLIFIGHFPQK